ncbi:hypothetical protein ACFOD0_06635 [Shewanella intestini]|uniref:Transporter substrate-binding domain-containing protein n=1 Tax=Shewanella intestini TaxID=2017544 RepID=A0ABS5HXR6_9GAMM|nr:MULTISPECIES: hypothetical protein [Shewanella]MBR9726549.1 hypothetical protein [Shewanella intestini]MRG34885.1 hypothetical protein [Shewanella sp. XMDDZSB0408]
MKLLQLLLSIFSVWLVAFPSMLNAHTVDGNQVTLSQLTPLKGVLMGGYTQQLLDASVIQPRQVIDMLHQHSHGVLNFSFAEMSKNRSWVELMKQPNACLFNKLKTPEREKVAYFSHYPIMLYPPIRLIVLNKNRDLFADEVDLERLDFKNTSPAVNSLIGVSLSRTYGEAIDKHVAQNQDNYFIHRGIDANAKLIEMLKLERISAIFEYSDVAHNFFKASEHTLVSVPIKQANQAAVGYLACSKTDYGLKLITSVNEAMSTKAFQQQFVQLHHRFVSVDDKQLLIQAINRHFN